MWYVRQSANQHSCKASRSDSKQKALLLLGFPFEVLWHVPHLAATDAVVAVLVIGKPSHTSYKSAYQNPASQCVHSHYTEQLYTPRSRQIDTHYHYTLTTMWTDSLHRLSTTCRYTHWSPCRQTHKLIVTYSL